MQGHSVCIGLSAYSSSGSLAPQPTINGFTLDNLEWVRELVELLASQPALQHLCFSSVQINDDTTAQPHEDARDRGVSAITALGNFKGGELVIESSDGAASRWDISEKLL